MTACMMYITCSDREEALRIGRTLVQERLVACVNVLDGMTSVYWWEGKLEQGQECVLIGKTRQELVENAIARVKSLHSYDCPCAVSWSIEQANPDYLKWIAEETRSGPLSDVAGHRSDGREQ